MKHNQRSYETYIFLFFNHVTGKLGESFHKDQEEFLINIPSAIVRKHYEHD